MKELVQRHKKPQCRLKQSIAFENSCPLSDYAVHCCFQNSWASKHTQALWHGVRIPSPLSHQVQKQGRLPGRSWCCTKTPSQHLSTFSLSSENGKHHLDSPKEKLLPQLLLARKWARSCQPSLHTEDLGRGKAPRLWNSLWALLLLWSWRFIRKMLTQKHAVRRGGRTIRCVFYCFARKIHSLKSRELLWASARRPRDDFWKMPATDLLLD